MYPNLYVLFSLLSAILGFEIELLRGKNIWRLYYCDFWGCLQWFVWKFSEILKRSNILPLCLACICMSQYCNPEISSKKKSNWQNFYLVTKQVALVTWIHVDGMIWATLLEVPFLSPWAQISNKPTNYEINTLSWLKLNYGVCSNGLNIRNFCYDLKITLQKTSWKVWVMKYKSCEEKVIGVCYSILGNFH